jgi:hypothetical protein
MQLLQQGFDFPPDLRRLGAGALENLGDIPQFIVRTGARIRHA